MAIEVTAEVSEKQGGGGGELGRVEEIKRLSYGPLPWGPCTPTNKGAIVAFSACFSRWAVSFASTWSAMCWAAGGVAIVGGRGRMSGRR